MQKLICRFHLSLIISFCSLQAYAFTSHNTPPVFDFKREWLIQENEPVGSRVITVRTHDDEGDHIEYGIEPALYVDGSQYFRINKDTGEVQLNKSLAGQGGNDFYLFVTANDGHQTAKIEVYVRVVDRGGAPNDTPLMDVPFSTSRPRHRPFPPFVPSAPHPALPPSRATHPFRPQGHAPAIPSPPATALVPVRHEPPVREVPPREGSPAEERGGVEGGAFLSSTLLPILAVTGLAPVIMLLLWFLHKRCKQQEKIVALKKASIGARREGSLSDSVAFSYSPAALLRPTTPPSSLLSQGGRNHSSAQLPRVSSDDKWEFPRHRLQFLGILGEGCFGQVWKCEAQDIDSRQPDTAVAVKTLKENATEKEKKDLLSELEVMKLLEPHPNVVTLLGCCSDKDPILVIMEYVSRGKLQTYLRESRAERLYGNLHGSSKHLTSRDLTAFSYQVAKGMEYLANKGIIHRDLAARNILVDENKVCKVADFGFARDVIVNHIYERKSEGRLPIRWMAPESLFDNIYTTKTDVWSFGVLLWEIVTLGSTPYPGLSATEVIRKVRDGYRLEKPDHCRREMYNIMFYCWDRDSKERPTFGELVVLLDRLLVSEHIYIELERFPDHSYYNITDLSGEKL